MEDIEFLDETLIRNDNIKDEEVEKFIQDTIQDIKHRGYYSFHNIQAIVHNFHRNDAVRVRVFNRLSVVNQHEAHWQIWKYNKEKQLGRPLTQEEIYKYRSPAKPTKEEVDALMAKLEAIKARNHANKDAIKLKQEQETREYWRKVRGEL